MFKIEYICITTLLLNGALGGMFDFMKDKNTNYYNPQNYWEVPKVYDYIVVGGGSAGGMAAMRLANYGHQVLLLEVGPEPQDNYNITVPAFSTRASEDPKISLEYFVKHYKESTGIQQSVYYPRANGLGGCSLHHAQIALYPQARDFEMLYQLTGNPVFIESKFRDKYFKPMENCNYPLQVNRNEHGFRGWYPTSYSPLVRMLNNDKSLGKILAFLGGDPTHDANGYINGKPATDSVGLFNIPSAVHATNYTRMNYLGQLQMARALSPLTILTDTLVTKVLFDQNKKAIGVNVNHGKYLYKASPMYNELNARRSVANQFYARHEVIIAAGTFNTPQLLMLSGIGDEQELKQFDIPVISALKGVGKNLLDRNEIPYLLKLPSDLTIFKDCYFSTNPYVDRCFKQYQEKSGAYLANSGISGEIYKTNKNLNEPDIFIINSPLFFHGYFKGYSDEAASNPRYFNRLILKAHTKSQGYVRLMSGDPRDVPDINLLKFNKGGEQDLNALINAVEYVRNRTRDEIGEDTFEEAYPGKNIKSRYQIAKWIIETTWGHHVCCTAKMGLDNDPMAVLDSRFRVRGVKGLRVMDMSALPDIPGFFPNLFIHMMGNLVADFINEERTSGEPRFNPNPSPQLLKELLDTSVNSKFDPLNLSPEFFTNYDGNLLPLGYNPNQVNIQDPFNLLRQQNQFNDPFAQFNPQQNPFGNPVNPLFGNNPNNQQQFSPAFSNNVQNFIPPFSNSPINPTTFKHAGRSLLKPFLPKINDVKQSIVEHIKPPFVSN